MNKKLLSITLAMLLAAAPLSVVAAADEPEVVSANEKSVTGTIKFDMGDWNHDDKVCFFIWDTTTNQYATKNGWQDGNTWASKKILGKTVDGEDGIVESYELTLYEGHDTFVIFHDQTTNEQTFNCVLTPAAIGHTAHMAKEKIENPVDSEKQDTAAVFDGVEGCGPQLTITSTGNVVGQYSAPNANGAATVAQYIFDRVGTVDKSGVECCTPEKVATAIEKFKTTPEEVKAEFQKFADKEGFAEKAAAAQALFAEEKTETKEPEKPDEPKTVTGKIFFDMGDWNHDDKVCFFIWDTTTNQYATKNGWQDGNTWASKKIIGTNVDGKDGIVESYELTLTEGHDTFVIFHDQTTNEQTFNCVLTPAAIGHTARMAEEKIENPVDSEKQDIAAVFDGVEGCGPQLTITSTGNVVGQYSAPNANGAATVARYIFDRVGTVDKSGVECCTREKVATAIAKFGTTPEAVIAEFQKFATQEGYAEKAAAAMALFAEPQPPVDSQDVPPVDTPEPPVDTPEPPVDDKAPKGKIFFKMGDWDHTDVVLFYIWDSTSGLYATKNGWQDANTWGSKKIMGMPVDLEEGIVESYEFSIPEGHDVFVIFHDQTTNNQTYNCVITPAVFGHTAHMLEEQIESPVDSKKTNIVAVFDDVEGCGPQLTITSIGNVVGEVLPPNTDPATVIAQFVIDTMGKTDDEGNPICTPEKVANAIQKFGTTPEASFEAYAKLQGLVQGTAGYQVAYNQFQQLLADYYKGKETPEPQRKLGDVNGDGKVTAADSMVIQRYSVHLAQLDAEQLAAADVNGDGKVTAKDALIILRATIHIEKIPPIKSGDVA